MELAMHEDPVELLKQQNDCRNETNAQIYINGIAMFPCFHCKTELSEAQYVFKSNESDLWISFGNSSQFTLRLMLGARCRLRLFFNHVIKQKLHQLLEKNVFPFLAAAQPCGKLNSVKQSKSLFFIWFFLSLHSFALYNFAWNTYRIRSQSHATCVAQIKI